MWFCTRVDGMTTNDVSMDELHTLSQSKCSEQHYQAWLQMHGLKSEGTVLELKQWVKDFQTLPGGPPQCYQMLVRNLKIFFSQCKH